MSALLRVFCIRALRRTECKIAITVTLLFCLISFAETCLRFYGADQGELPSAAYAWAWNMDAMQVNASRVYLFFIMPIAGALVFFRCRSARFEVRKRLLTGVSLFRHYMCSRIWGNEFHRCFLTDVCGAGVFAATRVRGVSCRRGVRRIFGNANVS